MEHTIRVSKRKCPCLAFGLGSRIDILSIIAANAVT